MQNKISLTREQFNELSGLLANAWDAAKAAFAATAPAFSCMSKHKNGRAIICKITDDLVNANNAFLEISELLQNIKDNYLREITNENINEGETEND
jgi:glutathionylspermidine synthase